LRSGRDHTALRRTLLAKDDIAVHRFEGRFQPTLNIQQHPSILDVRANRLHQQIVIKIVKGSFDVELNDPVITPATLARHCNSLFR